MNISIHWRRPLFYCLIPVLLFLAFVGFPPPVAAFRALRAGQEQSVPAEAARKSGGAES